MQFSRKVINDELLKNRGKMVQANSLREEIENYLLIDQGLIVKGESKDNVLAAASKKQIYKALATSMMHRIMKRWGQTNKTYQQKDIKTAYYFSLEYLIGRSLTNNIINLQADDYVKKFFDDLGIDFNEIEEIEMDAGLGNGGLGRLAACYLESAASLKLPLQGYGLRYDRGIFAQSIRNGYQIEEQDNWLLDGNIWEIKMEQDKVPITFGGELVFKDTQLQGRGKSEVINSKTITAVPYDFPVVGYDGNVNTLRLWSTSQDFFHNVDFDAFNRGEYHKAYHLTDLDKLNITSFLYPNDNHYKGKEIRLMQEFTLVTASLQDIIRKFKQKYSDFSQFPKKAAIQINDTHPTLSIPELMRILIDQEGLPWDEAWKITQSTISYTNHTVLPEAMEQWDAAMVKRLLPRQYNIIELINLDFCNAIMKYSNNDLEMVRKMSIIEPNGDGVKKIKMAHLSIVGTHFTNGVAELHSGILRGQILNNFYKMYPKKFGNVTNGVTQRRWLKESNPELAELITSSIGNKWIKDLSQLKLLEKFIDDRNFLDKLIEIKNTKKAQFAKHVLLNNPVRDINGNIIETVELNQKAIFDVQAKRLHEYKRQLMNALHILMLYNYIKTNPDAEITPRVFLFGAKAASGYAAAKDIIKFIGILQRTINHDPDMQNKLQVLYLENYRVSLAEKLIPAADISEQISTAGQEASGTGNMKFALNGALTVGTMDGANVEMAEEINEQNMFIFGLRADEVAKLDQNGSYNPWDIYNSNSEIKAVINMLSNGDGLSINDSEKELLYRIQHRLMNYDQYYVLKDLIAYRKVQQEIALEYQDKYSWAKKTLLNIARMGKFSSDRSVKEYADSIWEIEEVPVE